jgi:hypothetical protein
MRGKGVAVVADHDGQAPGPGTITNLTARRIAIASKAPAGAALIVPPFGKRVLEPDQVSSYAYEPWEGQRLVTVQGGCDEAEAVPPRKVVLCYLSGYCFLIALLLSVAWAVTDDRRWGWGALGGIAVTALAAAGTGWHTDAWRQLARSLNVFLGLLLTFGASAGAVWFMVVDTPLDPEATPGLGLTLVILWLFISMASVLPPALFLFFHRQKVPTLRTNFLQDVVRLDPNVQTVEDAESRYDGLIRDVYGSAMSGTSARGRLPLLAATGVITGLWIWTLVPGLDQRTTLRSVLIPDPDVVSFAFLGAYVFAINMLFRRYTRADMGPKVYTHIIVRIFAAVASTWVLSFAPFARTPEGQPRAMMLLLAFFIGIIPETGTAIVQDLLQQWKPIAKAVPSLAEDHPLSRLEGLSLYDRSQFLEVGIENVESLAHHNIVDLMLWTRIPTARLVDFVDQSILYLHVRGPAGAAGDGSEEDAQELLRRHGIRSATDLERAYALASGRSQDEGERLLGMLDGHGAEVRRLRVVLDAMEDDEWMVYVRNWRDQSSVGEPVASVEEFLQLSARGVGPVRASLPPSALEDGAAERAAAPETPNGSATAPVDRSQ